MEAQDTSRSCSRCARPAGQGGIPHQRDVPRKALARFGEIEAARDAAIEKAFRAEIGGPSGAELSGQTLVVATGSVEYARHVVVGCRPAAWGNNVPLAVLR